MFLTLTWQQIAVRLLLASIASFLIGLNRDEDGHPAGMRTSMLVCLAATLAMLQVNLMLPMSGKTPSSFAVMDLERMPLGILSGIGFLGAGVILKRGNMVTGVTTAATMWFVTVLGLLFGGGQLKLAVSGTLLGLAILWLLKLLEARLPREHHGTLSLTLSPDGPEESDLRERILLAGFGIVTWCACYDEAALSSLRCELKWSTTALRKPQTPPKIAPLRTLPGIRTSTWEE